MDIFGLYAVLFLAISIFAVYMRPQIIIGVQLFATPMFGLALKTLGLGIGSVNTIFALALFSLFLFIRRTGRWVRLIPSTFTEVVMLSLMLWVATSLTYTPSPNYGTSKLIFLIFISFPCLFIARFYCTDFKKVRETFVLIGWYAMLIVAFFTLFVALNSAGESRIRSSFFGPLTLGYITVGMVPFLFAVFSSSGLAGKLLSSTAILGCVYVLAATGSRGPALAFVLGSLLAVLRVRNFLRVLLGMIVVGWASYHLASKYAASGLERILGETEGGARSADSRSDQFQAAIEQFGQFPIFGQGSGSYSFFFHSLDIRYYPHNSFLEIAGELGVVGLIIYCSIIFYSILRIVSLRVANIGSKSDYYWVIASIQALFYAGLVNSCLSFDFPSQRILFVSLGLLAATSKWNLKT